VQNRYVGDIGDFGKFGLLRAIEDTGLRLGVNWYLTPDETHNNDGQHLAYLRTRLEKVADCDPELFHVLDQIVAKGDRNVAEIRRQGIFKPDTAFYETALSFSPSMTIAQRKAARESWHAAGVAAMTGCDVVFIDPDNGLESRSVTRLEVKGPKHAYLDELLDYVGRGQSLVIYHHLDRSGDAQSQANRRMAQLQEALPVTRTMAVKFNRISPRFYFIVPAQEHEGLLEDCIERFLAGPWGANFSRAY
jgi:hypothetical protein